MSDEIISNALPDPEPAPPREPEAIECCGSGCVPCVYDLYWDAVARYEDDLDAWQKRNNKKPPVDGAAHPDPTPSVTG